MQLIWPTDALHPLVKRRRRHIDFAAVLLIHRQHDLSDLFRQISK